MLSDLEVGQFWTFGFTILKGGLSEREVECLQEAHNRVAALCLTPQEMWTDQAIVDGIYVGAKV